MIPRADTTATTRKTYRRPEIRDHGSLGDLTADFDLHFVGSVARVATMAMASSPGPSGGEGPPPEAAPGPNPLPFAADSIGDLDAGGDTGFGDDDSGGGSGGGDAVPSAAGDLGDAGGGGAGAGDPSGALPGDGGSGELPFTGYPAHAVASLGAALTVAGMTLRSKLSRTRR